MIRSQTFTTGTERVDVLRFLYRLRSRSVRSFVALVHCHEHTPSAEEVALGMGPSKTALAERNSSASVEPVQTVTRRTGLTAGKFERPRNG